MAPTSAWELTDVVTRLRRVLRASIRSEFAQEVLPMAQVELLQRLADEPALRVRELAERHRLAANTVSGLIQQLVETDLVSRTTDARDRRAVTVSITDAGSRALAAWLAAHERRLGAALDALADDERSRIDDALPALGALVARLEQDG